MKIGNAVKKYVEDVVKYFRQYRGRMSFYCYDNFLVSSAIEPLLKTFNVKSKNKVVIIVVKNFDIRAIIFNGLNNAGITKENGYTIKLVTVDLIKTCYEYKAGFTITIGLDNSSIIEHLSKTCDYMLNVLNSNENDSKFKEDVTHICKIVHVGNFNAAKKDYFSTPVEGVIHKVALSAEDKELYDKYTEDISNCIAVVGNIPLIEQCRTGDKSKNISAYEICYKVAINNGWSNQLDMSIEFNREVDKVYNPTVINERAHNFYNIVRLRRNLVVGALCKLEKIKEIVDNSDANKIAIISKSGELAAECTKYLNKDGIEVCIDYHDNIEDSYVTDEFGDVIRYKSGAKKGEPKLFKSDALCSLNNERFLTEPIKCISLKQSSSTRLKTAVSDVIMTSPNGASFKDLMKRFASVKFEGDVIRVHIIIVDDTIEESMLKEQEHLFNKITYYDEELLISNNNADFGNVVLPV